MNNRKVVVLILFLSMGFASVAQGATPPPPMPPPPPGLPIDGGAFLLFALALSFGIYKAYKISKKTA